MVKLLIAVRNGEEHEIEATEGNSVMQSIRDAGIDELYATCGGSMSCATCHVYVDSMDMNRLPPRTDDEDSLLDSSDHKTIQSRLSCQLVVSDAVEGLRVTIAPEG